MSPLPEMPALPPPGQMLYLFLQSLAPDDPRVVPDVRATSRLYPVYGTFPRIWGIDALTDQLIAGLIMKLARRAAAVGGHRRDLLPLVQPGAA